MTALALSLKNYATSWFENNYNFMPNQFYCQIHLTKACEYHCAHCYFIEIEDDNQKKLSVEHVKKIIDDAQHTAKSLGLSPLIDFTGGDPLLHPNFFEIAEYAKSKVIPFGIKGNPDLLNGEVLQKFKRLGLRNITLSLEGLENIHDSIRGNGSFSKTITTIGRLKDQGFSVRVHTTVSKFNIDQLIPILNFFITNNFIIDNWTWSRFWSKTDVTDIPSRGQLLNLLETLTNVYEELFSNSEFYFRGKDGQLIPKVFVGFKEHLWFPYLAEKGYIADSVISKILSLPNSINCTATKHVYIIDTDGKVYKCRKIVDSFIGNIITSSFEVMINSDLSNKFVCMNRYSICGDCKYYNGCGGCAAFADAKRKSIWAGDPDCFIDGMPSAKYGEFLNPLKVF